MAIESLDELSRIELSAICIVMGALSGALSFGLKVEAGRTFRLWEFFLHVATSGCCGFMTYEILDSLGFKAGVNLALCCLSGWMGTSFIHLLEVALRKRLGITEEDLREK